MNKLRGMLSKPESCIKLTILASLLVHIAFLVKIPHKANTGRQIVLDSQKSNITLINYASIQFKWEEIEPFIKLKSATGEIPGLFKEKKHKQILMERNIMSVSLSADDPVVKETYEAKILKRIHRMKYYPQFAKKNGNEGTVSIKFTLSRDGALKGPVEVIKACGYDILNKAGIITIKNASPFPVFPDELSKGKESMTFIVNVEYSIKLECIK